ELLTMGSQRDIARLVHETVQNSIQHGLAKNVWLTTGLDTQTNEATLTFEDDGRGFLYRETSDVGFCLRMESGTLKSRGIGVLICRRILSRYKGRIDYSVKPEGGVRVDIRWRPDLKRPDEHSILAPYGLRIEA
ncbi:MAG: ATP-binding protein, partial [Fibrobacterota bacterium]